MFKTFTSLQWKSFFRSANFGKSMAVKVIMIFFGIYMLISLALAGGGMYFLLRKVFPDQNPMWIISQYFVYWILIELFLRYFMQKLPVMDIKPFLTTPVKKSSITHYILGRSAASIYNLLSLFFFIPFCIVLLAQGYPALNVLLWLLAICAIILCINYTNLLINKSDKALIALGTLLVVLYGMDYFGVFSVKAFFGPVFHALYAYPITVLVPMTLALLLYYINYKYLLHKLYLDATLKDKTTEATTSDMAWTKRFGDLSPFLQLDLKLIWRNKRTKSQVFRVKVPINICKCSVYVFIDHTLCLLWLGRLGH